MALEQELLELEKGFWTEDGDYYRGHIDEECLLAFKKMAGAHSKEAIAGMNPGAWEVVELDKKGCIQFADDAVMLTYEVKALRKTGKSFRALVSTGYVYRDGEWKMAFHQQTPLDAKAH